MGVMSRRVVPACSNLCCFCPSLRARSRQPVKRYKKLLADIFPRNQEATPNDRKIGKLCEYASKNPLRIPKIVDNLEQRFYKDLRNRNFGSVKVVLCIYRRLLLSCKEQMSLFANSLLRIIHTLMEQRDDAMRISGCSTLVDFINCQINAAYMFNLEGFIPKLCELAQEVGKEERALCLRSAGLQAVSSMVWFMGEHSHVSVDFDKIISVTLENYISSEVQPNTAFEDKQYSSAQNQQREEHCNADENGLCPPEISTTGTEMRLSLDAEKAPSYWSRVCLRNCCRLVKQGASVRRVLEPLCQNFDTENHWSLEKGTAYSVLIYLQSILEESGGNSHHLLSILAKHLEHKNVIKQPHLQINIINVTTQLAINMKQQASTAIIGAIFDMIRRLRKCLQNLAESSSSADDAYKLGTEVVSALERCILELSNKVGDVGPILDMMAVVLENISTTTNTIFSRTTISAVYRTSKMITSIPNISYHKKAFPDALFHQLLLAMGHPDHEIRAGAHKIFCTVLMPNSFYPSSDKKGKTLENGKSKSFSIKNEGKEEAINFNGKLEGSARGDATVKSAVCVSHSHNFSSTFGDRAKELSSLRLSSHQVSLLLSSIWVQATSAENHPANFEAMAHTYSITLLFTRSKTSRYMALVRCFQLAFSLRSISFNEEGGLRPSCRRSLFTLASYMLIFSGRAGNAPNLIPIIKASLTERTIDPFLELVDDVRLQTACTEPYNGKINYASQEDDIAALESLAAVDPDDKSLKDAVISHFMSNFGKLTQDELSDIKNQLLQGFYPDDAYPMGPPLFMETPQPSSPLVQIEMPDFDAGFAIGFADEEVSAESNGNQSDRRTSISANALDILSVNQLLESVSETAQQVARATLSTMPVSYDQIKNQCEALVTGKQEKMSVLHSFEHQEETKAIIVLSENERKIFPLPTEMADLPERELTLVTNDQIQGDSQHHHPHSCEFGDQHSIRLPPSSPYDKFWNATRC